MVDGFRAPIWTNDEAMFGRLQTSQVWFYEVPDFGKSLLLLISTDHSLFPFFLCRALCQSIEY